MKLSKEDMNISYFEYQCEKYSIDKKYLHFLNPVHIEFILAVCCIRISKKMLIQMLNENVDIYKKYTTYSFDDRIRKIRSKLIGMKHHAQLFGIDGNIKSLTVDELHDIVDNYYSELNQLEKKSDEC